MSSSWLGQGEEGLLNSPLWAREDRKAGRRSTKSEEAGTGQQGGPPLAQLPGPGPEEGAACPSPFPPRPRGSFAAESASWAPAKPNSCQGRGRSISEQRGPCGFQLEPRIPLYHRQVKTGVCAHAHRHARMALGSPGQRPEDLGCCRTGGWDRAVTGSRLVKR